MVTKIIVLGIYVAILFLIGILASRRVKSMSDYYLGGIGVNGKSPFTLEDVIVEQCGGYNSGVVAWGTACVARCTNVEVRQCESSGVFASNGGSITLMGAKTTVHHNCTSGGSDEFGFSVCDADSKIQLVHPLTKESVATNNPGGGNWGADSDADINQIQTIPAE